VGRRSKGDLSRSTTGRGGKGVGERAAVGQNCFRSTGVIGNVHVKGELKRKKKTANRNRGSFVVVGNGGLPRYISGAGLA